MPSSAKYNINTYILAKHILCSKYVGYHPVGNFAAVQCPSFVVLFSTLFFVTKSPWGEKTSKVNEPILFLTLNIGYLEYIFLTRQTKETKAIAKDDSM